MARAIREVETDDVTLEEIQCAGLELKEARETLESAKLVLKAAKDTVIAAQDRLDILVGVKDEVRPLFDGGEEASDG